MSYVFETVDTPDGPFSLLASDETVVASGWTAHCEQILAKIGGSARRPGPQVRDGRTIAADSVRAYYAGDTAAINTVNVRQRGTEWQQLGWAALRSIDPGQPLSYAEFAKVLGSPAAVRAAAAICARNAAALFVPCHRVLRSDGSLGGFAWGVEVKRALLDRELRDARSASTGA